MKVYSRPVPGGKSAATLYKTLRTAGGLSLVLLCAAFLLLAGKAGGKGGLRPGAGCGIIPAGTPGEASGRKVRACRVWPCKDGLPGRQSGKTGVRWV